MLKVANLNIGCGCELEVGAALQSKRFALVRPPKLKGSAKVCAQGSGCGTNVGLHLSQPCWGASCWPDPTMQGSNGRSATALPPGSHRTAVLHMASMCGMAGSRLMRHAGSAARVEASPSSAPKHEVESVSAANFEFSVLCQCPWGPECVTQRHLRHGSRMQPSHSHCRCPRGRRMVGRSSGQSSAGPASHRRLSLWSRSGLPSHVAASGGNGIAPQRRSWMPLWLRRKACVCFPPVVF
eukprot:6491516-Amphidinium_carterae.3